MYKLCNLFIWQFFLSIVLKQKKLLTTPQQWTQFSFTFTCILYGSWIAHYKNRRKSAVMWSEQFFSLARTRFFWWDDGDNVVCFVADQHVYIYSANSLKQQSTERPVVLLWQWHIILTPTPCCSTLTHYPDSFPWLLLKFTFPRYCNWFTSIRYRWP
jgi:hypothetical protein